MAKTTFDADAISFRHYSERSEGDEDKKNRKPSHVTVTLQEGDNAYIAHVKPDVFEQSISRYIKDEVDRRTRHTRSVVSVAAAELMDDVKESIAAAKKTIVDAMVDLPSAEEATVADAPDELGKEELHVHA